MQSAARQNDSISADADLSDRAESSKISLPLLVLCFAMTLVDGFDTLSISFAAPAIAADWRVASVSLGGLFSAGLLGGLVGALLAPSLAARGGYRKALILCAVWFSAGTFAVYLVASVVELGVLRFFTGVGLGAAIPVLTAVTTEYFPKRFRSRAVSAMLIGMPIGGLTAGLLSALLIPQHGWRVVFLVGGIAPLLVVPFLWKMMPRGQANATQMATEALGWRGLLKSERPWRIVLVASACLLGMMIAYSIANWAPTLLRGAGLSTRNALLSASLLHIVTAGIMLMFGWLIDRLGLHRAAAIGYLAGAPFLAVLTLISFSPLGILIVIVGGLLILGTPVALPVLAAESFSPRLRVEAVSGYAVMARVGAAIGPFASGVVIQFAGGMAGFTTMLALASVTTGVIVLLLRRWTATAPDRMSGASGETYAAFSPH